MCDKKLLWMCRVPQYDATQYGMDVSHPIYVETQEEVKVWMDEHKHNAWTASAFWICANATTDNLGAICDDCKAKMAARVMSASQ